MRKFFRMVLSVLCAVCCVGLVACKNDKDSSGKPEGDTQVCVLNELELKVGVDESFTLQVLGNDLALPIEWYSANANIAAVENGEVLGVAPGKTEIIAKVGTQTLTCEITVAFSYNNVAYITLENEVETENGYELLLLKGSTYVLSPVLMNGEKVEGVSFNYTSSSAAVTAQNGTLTAVSAVENAEVTVSCTYENQTYALTVYVTVAE